MFNKSKGTDEIHLAFSGGGYRAAAFCLGVLAYLIDRKLTSKIRSISSVSGGSFLNLFIDQHTELVSIDRSAGRALVNDFALKLATRSLYFAGPIVSAFTIALIVGSVAIVVSTTMMLFCAIGGWNQLFKLSAIGVGTGCALIFFLLRVRNRIFLLALQNVFGITRSWGAGRGLGETNPTCQHVACATDLVRGEPVVFGADGTRSPSRGLSKLAIDPLRAMAFSAAFPFLTHPFVLKAMHLFPSSDIGANDQLALVDGGIINNLGTQWWEPVSGGIAPTFGQLQIAMVVDASIRLPRWPLAKLFPWGNLGAVSRIVGLIYSNSVRPRFDYLRRRDSTEDSEHIGISLAENPVNALKAAMLRDHLGLSSGLQLSDRSRELSDAFSRSQILATNLHSLGFSAVRDLVKHGYFLAMIECASCGLTGEIDSSAPLESWFLPNGALSG